MSKLPENAPGEKKPAAPDQTPTGKPLADESKPLEREQDVDGARSGTAGDDPLEHPRCRWRRMIGKPTLRR